MPRPPSDRVDEGFAIWSTEAERNDTRTAELMGVSQSTVSYWHRTYRWDERYLTVIQPDGQLMAGVALAGMRAGLPAVTERLLHIVTAKKPVYDADGNQSGEVYASQDRDAIQAAKLLAQYGLSGYVEDRLPGSIEAKVGMSSMEEILAVANAGDAHAAACMILEATVAETNTRVTRGKRI
jgi:hypothetical protein